jgi:putative phosphoribosyl transferase
VFQNRTEAGKHLARAIQKLKIRDPWIIALPRGGVPIGFEVAKALRAPMDLLVVRKIGSPTNPEYGIGAITEGGLYFLNDAAIEDLQLSPKEIRPILNRELNNVNRQVAQFRGSRPNPNVKDRNVVLVDDGLATGVTARIAIDFLRQQGAKQIILAAPVCAPDTAQTLSGFADQVICIEKPENFYSVGLWYNDFSQISDEQVLSLMNETLQSREARTIKTIETAISEEIIINSENIYLPGHLNLPETIRGIVLFAHGSGSSRFSPRNRQVAESLNRNGIGTLLFDLLSPEESRDRGNVFNIPLLANRLEKATQWTKDQNWFSHFPIGYFGASTGAGAALWAASQLGHEISAVVSRGGRPDLAIPHLQEVTAPVLLIVGGNDEQVIEINEEAVSQLNFGKLVVIPGASHLFEEPGALELVATHASEWFIQNFAQTMIHKVA